MAETIRDRNHIRRQVAALSAEGRISGIVLGALPVVVALGLTLLSPDFLKPLFQEPAGQVALFGGLVLMGLGVVWIRRIVKIKF